MANFDMSNYVPVNQRLEQFYKDHPAGRVTTELVEHDRETGFVMFKSFIFRSQDDAEPSATGHAFESRGEGYVNKTSYIENCETSAVGRALALLGYEITRGIASREEMQKVERMQPASGEPKAAAAAAGHSGSFSLNIPDHPAAPPQSQKRDFPKPVKPEHGKAAGPNVLATSAQLVLLRKKAEEEDLNADTFAQSEFDDVQTCGDLSKAAASYLIDQLMG